MDARTGVINNNLNLLMKRLTILTVIFMPLNVLASVFGMSEYSEFVNAFIGRQESPFDAPVLQLVGYSLFGVGLVVMSVLTYWLLKWFKLD